MSGALAHGPIHGCETAVRRGPPWRRQESSRWVRKRRAPTVDAPLVPALTPLMMSRRKWGKMYVNTRLAPSVEHDPRAPAPPSNTLVRSMPSSQARKAARAAKAATASGDDSAVVQPAAVSAPSVSKKRHHQEKPPPELLTKTEDEEEAPKKKAKRSTKLKEVEIIKEEQGSDDGDEQEDPIDDGDDNMITNAWEDEHSEEEDEKKGSVVREFQWQEDDRADLVHGLCGSIAVFGLRRRHQEALSPGRRDWPGGCAPSTNREDGSSRGMAFVELSSESDVHTRFGCTSRQWTDGASTWNGQ